MLLYTIFFVFGLKIFIAYFFKEYSEKNLLIGILLTLFIFISGVVNVGDSIVNKEMSFGFYLFHLLYLVPFSVILFRIFKGFNSYFKTAIGQWFTIFVLTFVVCFEAYYLFLFANLNSTNIEQRIEVFSRIILPIIWTVLGIILIYKGIRNGNKELNKMGFVLIILMMLKLYFFDVWQMDQVSRIIAFIVLGVLLLISSFMFQKLKRMLQNILEKDEKTTLEKERFVE